MEIEINNDFTINVTEDFLTVKDKKLYNKNTKQFEGVDGDIVYFTRNEKVLCGGTVDGYTCGGKIKIRGRKETFENVTEIHFERVSVITNSNTESEENEENEDFFEKIEEKNETFE